jgi:hypothetical protein
MQYKTKRTLVITLVIALIVFVLYTTYNKKAENFTSNNRGNLSITSIRVFFDATKEREKGGMWFYNVNEGISNSESHGLPKQIAAAPAMYLYQHARQLQKYNKLQPVYGSIQLQSSPQKGRYKANMLVRFKEAPTQNVQGSFNAPVGVVQGFARLRNYILARRK